MYSIDLSRDRFVNVTEEQFKEFVIEVASVVASFTWELNTTDFTLPQDQGEPGDPGYMTGGQMMISDFMVGSNLRKEWIGQNDRRDTDYYGGQIEDILVDARNEVFTSDRMSLEERIMIEILAMILWPNSQENPQNPTALGDSELVGTSKQFAWKSVLEGAGII